MTIRYSEVRIRQLEAENAELRDALADLVMPARAQTTDEGRMVAVAKARAALAKAGRAPAGPLEPEE